VNRNERRGQVADLTYLAIGHMNHYSRLFVIFERSEESCDFRRRPGFGSPIGFFAALTMTMHETFVDLPNSLLRPFRGCAQLSFRQAS
jgi:hypothetical protein